jgi:hypothetical protein
MHQVERENETKELSDVEKLVVSEDGLERRIAT